MSKLIGLAEEFYRLRVIRMDLGGDVEFDWRDDILWRTPPGGAESEEDTWFVEAITRDGREVATRIAGFADADEAREALDDMAADLATMTKSEFESEYLDSSA